jgi:2-phospho-L-lactate guanylyltransferase
MSSPDPCPGAPQWCLVVPVKLLHLAKSRLADVAGPLRADLALAFAADTVAVAVSSPLVTEVIAVTDDARAVATLAPLGCVVVPDEPDAGLNPALRHGGAVAAARHPGCGIGALSADLPALRRDDLEYALTAAWEYDRAVVADATGTGTTLFLTAPTVPFQPAFGPDSLATHVALGALELRGERLATVRRDVDTPADLADALLLGVGPRTAELAEQLALPG